DQPEKAMTEFKKSLYLNPEFHEVWYMMGNILMKKFQNFPEALKAFDKAIDINPAGMYYASRSLCYFNMGDVAKARTDAQQAMEKGIVIPRQYRQALKL